MEPALTQLMSLVGVAVDMPTGTLPRTGTCGASLEQGQPIPLCKWGSPPCPCTERRSPLGNGGGSWPGGAEPLASSRVSQARGNEVGKDTAPYGANESREDFQQQQIPFQLSLSPRPLRRLPAQTRLLRVWDPAWRPPRQAAELGWTPGKSFQQPWGWPQGRWAGWRVSYGCPTAWPKILLFYCCLSWAGAGKGRRQRVLLLPVLLCSGETSPAWDQAGRSPWPTLWKPALIWLGFNPWREGKNRCQLLWFEPGMWVHGHVPAEPPLSNPPAWSCGEKG